MASKTSTDSIPKDSTTTNTTTNSNGPEQNGTNITKSRGIASSENQRESADIVSDPRAIQATVGTSLEKPHPLRSPVTKRPSLTRAFTVSAISMVTNDEDLPPPRSRRLMYKAPLRLKFALSSKNAAWRLEDDDTDDSKHQSHGSSCTDETPFSYTASGLYFTSEQSRRDSRRLIKNGFHTEGELSSKRSSSSEGSDLSINSKTINVRSQSLENLSSPTSSTQSIDRAVSGKSPRLYRTLSMGQKPVPRQRLASVENRFSGTNKDQAKEKLKRRKENVLDGKCFFARVYLENILAVSFSKRIDSIACRKFARQNAEGFVPLEFAVMLGFHHIAKMLQAFGAKESSRVPFLDKHLRMLSNEAEQRLQDLTLAVVHVTNCTASEIKDNERQLREWEWRRLILKRMMNGLNNAVLLRRPFLDKALAKSSRNVRDIPCNVSKNEPKIVGDKKIRFRG
ncbi:predicted protein [Nematostella vectensis]|uniref:Uncharacterized protein n=1 Tax=Nematostella vectensis TaxID=45351 RepID=A7SS43_NEMVE|nr:predicted protein [Nematostella vectensis]|eukprot:XP_001625564.1 predicted protein [Nematostella vectensis]